MAFADALRALNALKAEGVIEEYAVAGALAIVFWTEPVPTYDLDVLIFLPPSAGPVVSLDAIYRWAHGRKHPAEKEHVVVEGVPTQVMQLQRLQYPLLARQRPLEPWERPWEIEP